MNEQAWFDLISKVTNVGMPSLLIMILVTGYKQVWVWGWQLRALQQDRDFWRAAALKNTTIIDRVVDGVKP